MELFWKRWIGNLGGASWRGRKSSRLTLPRLAVVAVASLALSLALSSCESVASSPQTALLRVIDASNYAPAANAFARGSSIAVNLGVGTVSEYASLSPSAAATVTIKTATTTTSTTTTSVLATASTPLLTGQHYSAIFADDGSSSSPTYTLTVLQDQKLSSATGTSTFRFVNQAANTGAVDIYIVPSDSTLEDTTALFTDLAVGDATSYTSFTAQTVTLVVTPTGDTTSDYTSSSLALTGGEVRTVVIIDNKLTSDPPVSAIFAEDAN